MGVSAGLLQIAAGGTLAGMASSGYSIGIRTVKRKQAQRNASRDTFRRGGERLIKGRPISVTRILAAFSSGFSGGFGG